MTTVLPITVSGGRRKPLRLAATLLIVLAGHALLLVVLGLQQPNARWLFRNSLVSEPVRVILWPRSRQAPSARGGGRGKRSIQKATAPAIASIETVPALPGTPAPAAGQGAGFASGEGLGWPKFGMTLARRIRPAIGCAHPELYRLNAREQVRCDEQLGEEGRRARFLGLMIPLDKEAAYDRVVHCRRVYYDNNTPAGVQGLGYVPSMRECPPDSH